MQATARAACMSNNSKVEGFIDALRNRILSGEFGREGRLPSFRTLATEYATTQETMNKTMQALQAEGLLLSMGAKGVFVNSHRVILLGHTSNFFKFLQEQVQDSIEEYIEKPTLLKVPIELAQVMNLSEDEIVIRRFKKQGTQQSPFRLEETFYPKKILTTAAIEEIKNDASFLPAETIKKKHGLEVVSINERVLSRLPNDYEQKLLKIVRNNPILEMKRIGYAKDKKTVIVYSRVVLNANHFLLSYDYLVE